MLTNMKKRDPGIDLLRVLAMGLIVFHHLMLHGGLTTVFPAFSASGVTIHLFNASTRCAVNVYALISGYVMVSSRFRPARLIGLWLQVVFYGVLAALCLPLIGGTLRLPHLLSAIMPVSHDQYWYFTCYFVVFCLSPFLNLLLRTLNKKQTDLMLAALTALFSLLPTLVMTDRFQLNGGYHPAWLMIMYLFGGAMRLHGIPRFGGQLKAWAVAAVCVLLGWGARLAALSVHAARMEEWLLHYTSPTVLLCSVALFGLFAECKLPSWLQKTASVLSPLTFGVYLIHDNPLVREYLIRMRLTFLAELNPALMLGGLFVCWAGVYGLCLLAEWVRTKLFAAFRVSALCERMEKKLFRWTDRLFPQAGA